MHRRLISQPRPSGDVQLLPLLHPMLLLLLLLCSNSSSTGLLVEGPGRIAVTTCERRRV